MSSLTLARLIVTLFNFYSFLILAYCILTWIPMRQGGLMQDIAAVLDRIVGPYLNLFKRFIPPMGGVDFSPVIAIIALNLIERTLVTVLY